jgi:hypothetical protein
MNPTIFLIFVLIVLLITGAAGLLKALIRGRESSSARRGSALDGMFESELVRHNEELKERLKGAEERIRVLERITTDTALRTAVDIENLR